MKALTDEMGLHWDVSDYQPLPDWKPCGALKAKDKEYDLQAIYYRVPHHQFSFTFQNAWLDEIAAADPFSNFVLLNVETARRKGIKDGDRIWIKAKEAGRVLGTARLTEGVHPEVVAIANNGGHWSRHTPVAKGKGTFMQALLPTDWAHTDPVAPATDCDSAVKVEKAGHEARNHPTGWEPR